MKKKKILVIVESPSKCKKIESYLNNFYKDYDFKCMASVGHIKNLPRKKLSVDIDDNFKPDFQIIDDPNNLKTVKQLKSWAKKYKTIVLATDPDREGERIAYDLAEVLNLSMRNKNRMVFNSITEDSVCSAFKNLKKINTDYVNSQMARRIIDRLIGYKISPIIMNSIQKSASAGRVLSITTKIIYDKKIDIGKYVKKYKFVTTGNFYTSAKKLLEDCTLNKIYKKKADVLKFLKSIQHSKYFIKSMTSNNGSSKPPAPFITSTINQASNYSVSKTTTLLQKLYESGYITYIRTDSTAISPCTNDGRSII